MQGWVGNPVILNKLNINELKNERFQTFSSFVRFGTSLFVTD
jgi:hypothetical protein